MNIKIEDYLSDDEIAGIVKVEVRIQVRKAIKSEKDIERIISNACYTHVSNMCDSTLDSNMDEKITKKVGEIVDNLSEFSVFKKPSAWDSESNSMYKFLIETINSRKGQIASIVESSIEPQTLVVLKDSISDHIQDAIQDLFVNNKGQ